MKTRLRQLLSAVGIALLSMPVMAHGDHSVITPEHGLEHALYYGLGIVAALLVIRLARKGLKQRNDQ